MTEASLHNIINLAESLLKNINKVTYGNSLSITTKINYKDLYSKADFYLFLDAVEYLAFEDYKNTLNNNSFIVFTITNKFKQLALNTGLIKEMLMINYLTTLWKAVQNDIS
jgi:hypothetical protein